MISWMFTTMCHHAAPLGESLLANVADVRSLSSMGELVHPERNRSGERFQADFALVRSFTGVQSCVLLQCVRIGEFLAAMCAKKSLNDRGGVDTRVSAKIPLGGKSFLADVALQLLRVFDLHVVCDAFMSDQIGLLTVNVVAVLTGETFRAQLTRSLFLQFVLGLRVLVALVAQRFRVHGAVLPDLMYPQSSHTFVL